MNIIESINSFLNGIVWGWPTMILLVGTGIFLSVKMGLPQITRFRLMMSTCLGKSRSGDSGKGSVPPLQALATALAATVGTGNIVGCSGAIISGGPGAVFWLWVSGIFGMCTKFSEVTLAIKYRRKNDAGENVGGPMYYITDGLGKNWKWLAVIFAVAGMVASFGIGCLSQISSMVTAINTAITSFIPQAAEKSDVISLVIGLVSAAALALVIVGGIKRIAHAAEALIPLMSIIYLVCAVIVIAAHITSLPSVIASIFRGAFSPKAVIGGAVGITLKNAVSSGLGRGLFSNEAGQGSAPIAHAGSDTEDPVEQGLYGMLEVFFDTIVICTITCLAVLMSGVGIEYVTGDKNVLPIDAFATVFGEKFGSLSVAVSLLLFAFTTMITWSLYGVRCLEFLTGSRRFSGIYKIVFIAAVVYGATVPLGLAYRISDTLNGIMTIPNLVAVLGLSGTVTAMAKDYFARKK